MRRIPSGYHGTYHLRLRKCKNGYVFSVCQVLHLSTAESIQEDVAPANSILLIYDQIRLPKSQISLEALGHVLEPCSNVSDGNLIHDFMVQHGLDNNRFLGSRTVYMYLQCGAFQDALAIFANMCERILYTWNVLIQACPDHDQGNMALELFEEMQQESVLPNKITFLSIMYGCTSEVAAKQLHARYASSAFNPNLKISTALLNMYGRLGRVDDAWNTFERICQRDAFVWTAMIIILIEHGHGKKAIQLFDQMQDEGIPNVVTFVSILSACVQNTASWEAQEMHWRLQSFKFRSDPILQNVIISMHGKCGNLEEARTIFDAMPMRSVISWTSMISLYVQKGYAKAALILFDQMQCEAMAPDIITFLNIIGACAAEGVLDGAKCVHARIWSSDFITDAAVVSALVNMYGKCGSVGDARKVFNLVNKSDIVLWNSMLTVYTQNESWKEAILLFEEMKKKGLEPDRITFTNVLSACATCAWQAECEQMHTYIVENGLELEVMVANALINMYSRCGNLCNARNIFNQLPDCDVVSWTVLIAGYTSNSKTKEALQLLEDMQQQGILPDRVTLISVLDACANGVTLADCHQIHARILNAINGCHVCVQNAIINMYGKCGYLKDARRAFDAAGERDIITWNTLLTGYVQDGNDKEAFNLFVEMLLREVIPEKVTFIIMLSAFARESLITEGELIHLWIMHSSCELDVIVQTALITLYGKCGHVEDAKHIFDRIVDHSVFSWNASIAAYAHNGWGRAAVELFQKMLQSEIKPDAITFLAVLVACSHSGLIEEGHKFFAAMTDEYNITPWTEHHACLADLLGRAGQLDEAESVVGHMSHPLSVGASAFTAILSACWSRNDLQRGDHVAKLAIELKLDSSAVYVMLSNIYDAISRRNAAAVKLHISGESVHSAKLITYM